MMKFNLLYLYINIFLELRNDCKLNKYLQWKSSKYHLYKYIKLSR